MLSNEIHKKLAEDSQKRTTVHDSKLFSVHFDYNDLCKRLQNVKLQKGSSSHFRLQSSLQLNINQIAAENHNLSSSNTKKSLITRSKSYSKKPSSLSRKTLPLDPKLTSAPKIAQNLNPTDSKQTVRFSNISKGSKLDISNPKPSTSIKTHGIRRRVSYCDKTSELFSPKSIKVNLKGGVKNRLK